MTQPSLGDALHRLMHAYRKELQAGIEHSGIALPITHLRALKAVCHIPDCTASTISVKMNKDKAQIARVLGGLIEAGMIEKREHPQDQRSQLLVATTAGRRMLGKINAVETQAVARMTRDLGNKDIDTFRRISERMVANVVDRCTDNPE